MSVLSIGFDSHICQHPSPEQTAFPAIPALCPDEHQWANPAGHGLAWHGILKIMNIDIDIVSVIKSFFTCS